MSRELSAETGSGGRVDGSAPEQPLAPVAENDGGRQQPGKAFWTLLATGISAGLLVLVLVVAVLAVVVPFVTGAQGYNILTDSMRPAYPPGTLVVAKPVEAKDLRIGDVITYQAESGKPTVITHRIIATTLSTNGTRSFTTMGDNNAVADPEPIAEDQIRGRVWYALPWIGMIASARQNGALGIIIPIAGFALIAYGGYLVISWLVQKIRRG